MKFSNHFRTLSQIVSAFHRSVFGDVVKTVFFMSIGALGRKTNFLTFYISLGSWARNFGPFSDKLLEGCQNWILLVHRNSLRKNIFLKNVCIVYHFGILSKNVLAICRKILRRVVKTAFHMSIGTVSRKTLFYEPMLFSTFAELEQKRFGLLSKKFWRGCHNCILLVHRKSLR